MLWNKCLCGNAPVANWR